MINKKSRSAVDIMVSIASSPAGVLVTAQHLSKTLGVSVSYVENILKVLREAELVQSTRGPSGGYGLAKPADAVSAWDIVQAVQDDTEAHSRGDADEAARNPLIAEFEDALQEVFSRYLDSRHLSEFLDSESLAKGAQARNASRFRLAPMPPRLVPVAPNSVFEWGRTTVRGLAA
jgi:Rrf2 family transcriptional regulator, iron-sulfur cluster assembly transcription factor